MKNTRKASSFNSKAVSEEFKSVDNISVPINTLQLSARTRNEQRKEEKKAKKIPAKQLKESIRKLSEPKRRRQPLGKTAGQIPKRTLNYKPSKRIEALATPRSRVTKLVNIIPESSFLSTISTGALNYKPTPRILKLARPKQYFEVIHNPNPVYESEDYESVD